MTFFIKYKYAQLDFVREGRVLVKKTKHSNSLVGKNIKTFAFKQ